MERFKGTNLIDFIERFPNDEKCKEYLAQIIWAEGFNCSKCSHTHFWMKKDEPHVRVCKSCRHINSSTANTLFHKVKFGLRKAFLILFEMSTTTKGCSSPVIARKYGINQKSAWLFMSKARKAMASSGRHPLTSTCEVDEILIGGKREGKPGRGAVGKKKVAIVIEKSTKNGIKRAYGIKISDFSSMELRKVFDRHIDRNANVETDKWRGYNPLAQHWNIVQTKSKPAENFQLIHRFIQQLKGWIRGIYHKVNEEYLQGYLDEFCFRLNRHLSKETIFDSLVNRMIQHKPITKLKLVSQ
jgi:transposase-like protein